MKIRIFTPSKVRQRFVLDGEAEYLKRMKPLVEIERLELGAAAPASLPEDAVMKQEAEMLASRLRNDEVLIVLDERGKQLSSTELASFLEDKTSRGQSRFAFVIGGAFGLDPSIKRKASLLLSLSKLTFPWQLTRLILIEQLYRAFTIIKGRPYHK